MKRRAWFRVHQWVGLPSAAVLVLSAVTGLVLLFRAELSPARPVAPVVGERLSLEELVVRGEAAGDGSPATDLGLPQAPEEPYTVWLDDDAETEVYLAADGRVLGMHQGAGSLTRVLFRLHTGELLGPLGTALMLAVGLCLLVLVTSGLAMLWSRTLARRGRGKGSAVTPRVTPRDGRGGE